MPRLPMIRVLANPYAHLDHEGRPAGVVMLDPVEHHAYGGDGEARRFVGAAIDLSKTEVYQRAAASSAQSDLQDTVFAFSGDVQDLPMTQYYLSAIRSGELLAADEATAEHAGIEFHEPYAALDTAKKTSLERWKAERPKRALPEWASSKETKREAPRPSFHPAPEVK